MTNLTKDLESKKLKCSYKDCCNCHQDGHEWEGEQASKYYIMCPMCQRRTRVKERVLD